LGLAAGSLRSRGEIKEFLSPDAVPKAGSTANQREPAVSLACFASDPILAQQKALQTLTGI
jgi:hypothetical protein